MTTPEVRTGLFAGRVRAVPLLVRGVVVAGGVLGVLAPGAVHVAPVLVTVLGLALAVLAPAWAGSGLALAGLVLCWLATTGWHGTPSDGRIVVAALALYLVHSATSLAAFLPIGSDVSPAVLWRWLANSVVPLAFAAAVIALDLAVPRGSGSPWFEFGALVAAVVVVGAGTRSVWLPARRSAEAVPGSVVGRAPNRTDS